MRRWPLVTVLRAKTLVFFALVLLSLWFARTAYLERQVQFRAALQPRLERLLGIAQAQEAISARRAAFEGTLAKLLFAAAGSPETVARQAVEQLAREQGVAVNAFQTTIAPAFTATPDLTMVRAVVTVTGEYAQVHAWHRALLAHRPWMILESALWLREGGSEQFREHQRVRLTVQLLLPFAASASNAQPTVSGAGQ